MKRFFGLQPKDKLSMGQVLLLITESLDGTDERRKEIAQQLSISYPESPYGQNVLHFRNEILIAMLGKSKNPDHKESINALAQEFLKLVPGIDAVESHGGGGLTFIRYVVAQHDNVDLIRLLIEKDKRALKDIKRKDGNYNLLGWSKSVEVAQFLLDEIGLTNLSGDKDAATSLLLTSLSKCDIDFFDFCIDRGAQIPPPDSNGNNLIHKAILSADLSDDEKVQKFGILLEKLIKCGVDINHKNKNGDTPLHTVILAHFAFTIPAPEEIQIIRAQALLRHGAKTDIKNKKSECLFEMENASPGVKEYVLQVREGLNLAMISQRTFKPSDKPGNTKGLPVVLARLATTYLGQ